MPAMAMAPWSRKQTPPACAADQAFTFDVLRIASEPFGNGGAHKLAAHP